MSLLPFQCMRSRAITRRLPALRDNKQEDSVEGAALTFGAACCEMPGNMRSPLKSVTERLTVVEQSSRIRAAANKTRKSL